MAKGAVTQIANAVRVVDGGEITSLSEVFTKGNGMPFSLKLVPKELDNVSEFEWVKVKLYQGDAVLNQWPIDVLSWSSELFIELHTDSAPLLDDYRIFYGTGADF